MTNPSHNPINVVVIQIGGVAVTSVYFEPFGLKDGRDFLLLNDIHPNQLLHLVHPGVSQLFLTSHGTGVMFIDARNAATMIKTKNPRALVIAFTKSDLDITGSNLDGIIRKSVARADAPSDIVRAFLAGKSRADIVEMLHLICPQ